MTLKFTPKENATDVVAPEDQPEDPNVQDADVVEEELPVIEH